MHDSSPIWRKHGDIFAHECVPEWRFEGRGIHFNYIPDGSRWFSLTNTGFMAIEQDAKNNFAAFVDWDSTDTGAREDGHAKCLSGGTIRHVEVFITSNTMPHDLRFSLWKDKFKEEQQFFVLEASSGLHVESLNVFIPLIFDHRYGYGFTTESGDIPLFSNPGQTMTGCISTEIFWGGGDS